MKCLLLCIWFILFGGSPSNDQRLKIGSRYTLCGPKEDNPFEEQAKAVVIITAIKKGYVQYCWAHDYKKPGIVFFSRSEKEFIDLIKACN